MIGESIDSRLLETFKIFDSFCRKNGVRYSIDSDEHNQQGYLVKLGDHDALREHMTLELSDKWVVMDTDNNRLDGTLFTFGIKVIGEKTVKEDQYKSPTKSHIRRQSAFPSKFGPTQSFGGIKGYGRSSQRLSAKLSEALKLKSDLLARDNETTIPSGTELEVHDHDPRLPDVDWDGQTTNVDSDKLKDAIDQSSEREYEKIFGEDITTIGTFIADRIKDSCAEATDSASVLGYISKNEKEKITAVIKEAIATFDKVLQEKCGEIHNREMDKIDADPKGKSLTDRLSNRLTGI